MTENKLLIEAINTIFNINEKIYESFNPPAEYTLGIQLRIDGTILVIEFFGDPIWRDDEDDRNFDEGTNEYEPLEPFIRNRIKECLENLKKVEL